ncbi:recombinase family protein [Novosphingobium sediminicola]|uniref:recombinase family protein n=1 Tax=Novosphingobium sediminicola TaxID=563162 RepID=UPI003CCC973F
MHRCAIYARFSTDRQSETSAEDQIRECTRFAESKGWQVVETYHDLAMSGANNRRPGLNQLLAHIQERRFDTLLVEDLDRIARDLEDVAGIFKRVRFAGARIWSLSAGEISQLHIGLKGTMDAMELEKMADKIRRGQRGSVARGRIPGGRTYGYDVVRQLNDRGELDRGLRSINPEQAVIVRRIMEEYADGRGPKAICRSLNAEGIPSPNGGEWSVSAIVGSASRRIGLLQNPIYTGRFVYNRVKMVRNPETRNRVSRVNNVEEHAETYIPEMRIISDELWDRVTAIRTARSNGPLVRAKRPRHLLSGLVRCGVCQGGFAVYSANRLGCNSHRRGGNCPNNRTITVQELQTRVMAGLEDKLLADDAVALLLKQYQTERDRRLREGGKTRTSKEKRLRETEAAIARLVSAIADGGADFTEIRAVLNEKKLEQQRLRAELADEPPMPELSLNPKVAKAYRERVKALLSGLRTEEITDSSASGQIRALIHTVHVSPGERKCKVEILGSLEAALALANTKTAKAVPTTVKVVAEEGLEPPTRGL